ncbi:MAG: hypothetical protein SGJ10_12385 [Bacteroidota bacterium]|nr:hypothetical protein [Bacteroidota bacterium]
MKLIRKKIQSLLLLALFVGQFPTLLAQDLPRQYLYVSKQTGQTSNFHGQQGKTTDKYEEGNVTINVVGPITHAVTPNDMSIGHNQTKTWQGQISPLIAQCPAPGSSVSAKLNAAYDVVFSRPQGGAADGAVILSTYNCSTEADGVNHEHSGCQFHGSLGGMHEIVRKIGTVVQDFEIFSINCIVPVAFNCADGTATLHADIYPGNEGTVIWQTPFGQLTGNDIQINLPPNFNNINVTATYTVRGVSYSANGVIRPDNLTGFALPCCANQPKNVRDIAMLTFDGPCHPPVVFAPAIVSPPTTGIVGPTNIINVTASANTVNLGSTITTVNENIELSVTPFAVDFSKIGNLLKDAAEVVSHTPGSPCSPSFSVTGGLTLTTSKKCCLGPCLIKDAQKIAGSVGVSAGVSCRFPIYGIPYVASLDALLEASIGVTGTLSHQTTCDAPKVCAELGATISFGLGIGASIAGGMITADLKGVVEGASASVNYCFIPAPITGEWKANLGKIKVVGTVTTLEVFNYTVEYTLFDGYEFGPFPL